jgi:hypothetical protein
MTDELGVTSALRRQRMQTRLDAITHSIDVLTDAATDAHTDDREHIERGRDRLAAYAIYLRRVLAAAASEPPRLRAGTADHLPNSAPRRDSINVAREASEPVGHTRR